MNRVPPLAVRPPPCSPIVLATHRAADGAFLRSRLAEAGVSQPVVTFATAETLLDYLGAVCIADSPEPRLKPCLLLLDDTLADGDAGEIIAWIRRRPALAGLRVVVLSDEAPTPAERATAAAVQVISRFPAAATLSWLVTTACGGGHL